MKKLIPISAVLLLGLWIGCGDDEPNGPEEPTAVRVIADTTVSAPTLSSADEQVWASVYSFRVGVSQGNRPKLRPPEAAAIPLDIYVQAIKKADNLYLRLQWSDTSFNAYPNRFKVKAVYTGGLLPYVEFENELVSAPPDEDQIFVMFDGLPKGGFDVWNWRVLTTGGAGLGKGYSYTDTLIGDMLIQDTLIEDAVGTAGDSVAIENLAVSQQPTYAHMYTSEFHGYILYVDSAVHREEAIDSIWDSQTQDWMLIFFPNTTGWDIGQVVPGWLINPSFASLDNVERGSRWDIRAVSVYDSLEYQYRVVLCRELNTEFSVDEDIDLSAMDSVKVKIGIYDNQDSFGMGSSNRGFSDDFWIILK